MRPDTDMHFAGHRASSGWNIIVFYMSTVPVILPRKIPTSLDVHSAVHVYRAILHRVCLYDEQTP